MGLLVRWVRARDSGGTIAMDRRARAMSGGVLLDRRVALGQWVVRAPPLASGTSVEAGATVLPGCDV